MRSTNCSSSKTESSRMVGTIPSSAGTTSSSGSCAICSLRLSACALMRGSSSYSSGSPSSSRSSTRPSSSTMTFLSRWSTGGWRSSPQMRKKSSVLREFSSSALAGEMAPISSVMLLPPILSRSSMVSFELRHGMMTFFSFFFLSSGLAASAIFFFCSATIPSMHDERFICSFVMDMSSFFLTGSLSGALIEPGRSTKVTDA